MCKFRPKWYSGWLAMQKFSLNSTACDIIITGFTNIMISELWKKANDRNH